MPSPSDDDLGFIPEAKAAPASATPAPKSSYDDLGFIPENKPKGIAPTEMESFLRGAYQGGTLGFGDELSGAYGGLKDVLTNDKYKLADLVDRYRQNRDASRAQDELARQTNPKSYTGGEIGGSIGTAFIPGLGAIKGAGLLGAVKQGALIGGLSSLGTSNADLTKGDIGGAASDVKSGALTGGVVGGVGHEALQALKGLTPQSVGKKLANVFLNTPEEATDAYIQNPQAVLNAPRRFEVAQNYEDALNKLQGEVKGGSQASRDILNQEGARFKGSDIANIFEQKAKDIADRTEGVWDNPEQKASYNWLKDMAEQYRNAPQQDVSANRVKDLLQGIDRSTQYETSPGTFGNIDDLIKKDARNKVDTMLKDQSPAYADQMKQVASDTALLNQARDVAKSPQGLANAFRRVQNDQYGGGQIPRDVIQQFGDRTGTDFLDQIKNSMARESFDKSITNGSRNVQMYSNMVKDSGIPGAGLIAPLVGGTVDKYGRKLTMSAVDAAKNLNDLYQTQGVQAFKQQIQPVLDAASKGNPTAVLTYQLLSKSNPDALKNLNNEDQK